MSYIALKQRLVAIHKLFAAAEAAEKLPDQLYNAAMAVRLDSYSTHKPTLDAFNVIRKRHADEERRQGEIARDRELKRLASELDRLRDELPALATAAKFDLVDTAREWRCAQ